MHATPALDIEVPARFNGPARTGNGGYVCGLVATVLTRVERGPAGDPATVTLRTPPPLDTPMRVTLDGSQIRVLDGERLVAEAGFGTFAGAPPEPVSPEDAESAAPCYAGTEDHPFPTCFACGVDRKAGDGLRIFPGKVDGRPGTVAAIWTPDDSVEDRGKAAAPVVWASLDCPGGWAIDVAKRPMVLGRMAGRVFARPAIGQRCVVVGEATGREGRKGFTATALYADGELLARSEAVWIAIDPATIDAG